MTQVGSLRGRARIRSARAARWGCFQSSVFLLRWRWIVMAVLLLACSDPLPRLVPLANPICSGPDCEICDKIPEKWSRDVCRQCNGTPCNDRQYSGQWNCDGMVCRDGKTVFHLCLVGNNCLDEEGPNKCCAEFEDGICPWGGHWCVKK